MRYEVIKYGISIQNILGTFHKNCDETSVGILHRSAKEGQPRPETMIIEIIDNIWKTRSLSIREKYYWFRGLFSRKHSCGKKNRYSIKSAQKAKEVMEKKYSKEFDIYRCIWCGQYHIGGSIKIK